jgi:hypothetical protein
MKKFLVFYRHKIAKCIPVQILCFLCYQKVSDTGCIHATLNKLDLVRYRYLILKDSGMKKAFPGNFILVDILNGFVANPIRLNSSLKSTKDLGTVII